MARVDGRPKIEAVIEIIMSEEEAAALYALTEYGVDAFLKNFYDKMGYSILKPHEEGLRSLFESVRSSESGIKKVLNRFTDARAVFDGSKVAVKKEG